MVCAVKHLPCDIVPQVIQRIEDGFKRSAAVMVKQSGYVFKEQILRFFNFGNPCDLKKERASRVIKSKSFSGSGPGLARKSSANKVEIRQLFGIDLSDIFIARRGLLDMHHQR